MLRHPCNVCFSFLSLSFSRSLSPLVSWIDFSFVLDSRDAQCWFQLYGGCFIACSVCLWWHSSIQFSTQEDPLGPGISQRPLLLQPSQRWTWLTSDLLPKHTGVSTYALLLYARMQTHTHNRRNPNTVTHIYADEHTRAHACTHHKPPSPHSILAAVSHCSKSS